MRPNWNKPLRAMSVDPDAHRDKRAKQYNPPSYFKCPAPCGEWFLIYEVYQRKCNQCGRVYCADCIEEWDGKICMVCAEGLDSFVYNVRRRRMMEERRGQIITCLKDGCDCKLEHPPVSDADLI